MGISDVLHAALVGGYRPRVVLTDRMGRDHCPVTVESADRKGVVVRTWGGTTVRVEARDTERGLRAMGDR
jgi:hypothetical protein